MNGDTRHLRIVFQSEWDPASRASTDCGLFAADPRVRTLVKVLVSYPEVRYVLPDRISLDNDASVALLESIGRFLGRQSWLVKRIEIR
jgi:hypothetical protein